MSKVTWSCAALSVLIVVAVSSGVVAENNCSIEGFDLVPLTKSYWAVFRDDKKCPNPEAKSCSYWFSLCYGGRTLDFCPGATACIHQGNETISLGSQPHLEAFDNEKFLVTFHGSTLNVTYQFQCNPKSLIGGGTATSENVLVAELHASDVVSSNQTHKTVVIEYAGACRKGTPKPSGGMGPGGQLFIILLVLGLLYFGGGAAYNHVNGARGVELIPHHWFWTDLPGFVLDGCFFLVRLITCQSQPTYNQNPDYGATSPTGVSPAGGTYESF